MKYKAPVRKPLYETLPFGSIKARGWMERQLKIHSLGIPGRGDECFFQNEWWLGGPGADHASRRKTDAGASHIVLRLVRNMLVMGYMLDYKELKAKVKKYVEYWLSTREPDGSFGPKQPQDGVLLTTQNESSLYEIARVYAADIMLDYYGLEGDERCLDLVKSFILNYYGKVIQHDAWSWGNNARQKVVLGVALKLYKYTGDEAYLDAVYEFISYKTPENDDETQFKNKDLKFKHGDIISHLGYMATDSLFMDEDNQKEIIDSALEWLDETQGQAPGHYTCHEFIAAQDGKNPTNGAETCTITWHLLAMKNLFSIYGDTQYADRAERMMFNAVPACTTADSWARQYDQMVNQVVCSVAKRRFDNTDDAQIFGLNPHYPCCSASIAWPLVDFINGQWLKTKDGGLAALSYCSCEVNAEVAGGVKLKLTVDSDYPFRGNDIKFTVHLDRDAEFPLYLRAPDYIGAFNERTAVYVDGRLRKIEPSDTYVLKRLWHDGDTFTMSIPMNARFIARGNGAVAVARGPLFYSLRVGEAYRQLVHYYKGAANWEIYPTTPWNIGLYTSFSATYGFITEEHNPIPDLPWVHDGAVVYNEDKDRFETWHGREPVVLHTRGHKILNWGMHKVYPISDDVPPEENRVYGDEVNIELIPYGCTNLRIAEFPGIL